MLSLSLGLLYVVYVAAIAMGLSTEQYVEAAWKEGGLGLQRKERGGRKRGST